LRGGRELRAADFSGGGKPKTKKAPRFHEAPFREP
jgi:hypothetical protein